jgi:hypothetical protein
MREHDVQCLYSVEEIGPLDQAADAGARVHDKRVVAAAT